MSKRCFMFGHHTAPEGILPLIEQAVEEHYQKYGVREFVVGKYGNFDRLAPRAVAAARKRHDDIRLIRLLAYHPTGRVPALPEAFDGTIYPDGMENVPYRLAIIRANLKMIDTADSVICYVRYAGNTGDFLRYSQRRGLPVINVGCHADTERV